MMLPSTLKDFKEWTFVGPMGPDIPGFLSGFPVIAVDGGAHFTTRTDVWVGDSDSYNKEVHAEHIYRHPVEKETSDLAMALSLFKDSLHYRFHFWGFLGGRKDHELFNIGEALAFLENHHECEIILYDETGKKSFHLLANGHWKFSHEGLFSLGTMKRTLVKLTGNCQYPIPKTQNLFPLSSFGLSNVARGELILETEGPVFLYFPEGK